MFEAALIESTRQKVDTRRWMTLPLAIILHVVVIGSAVALSLWYIEEIPDPPIPVSFYVQAAPPPPPPPPPPKAAAPKAQPKVEQPPSRRSRTSRSASPRFSTSSRATAARCLRAPRRSGTTGGPSTGP